VKEHIAIINEYYNRKKIRINIKFNVVQQCIYIYINDEILFLLYQNIII
jgi:hypothetical protein